ncbi:MAG: hypothetical protein RL272_1237 [Candidatus Parcubacteria bacterium]|jgi:uncharacterized protein YkwD
MDWSRFPWVDIGIVVFTTWYMASGYRRGFIVSSLDALGFFTGFAGSLLLYAPAAAWVSSRYGVARPFAKPLAFFVLLVVLQFLANRLATLAYRRIPMRVRTARVNRALGAIPGFLDAAFTVAIVLSLALAMPMPQAVKRAILGSPTGAAAVRASGALDAAFTGVFGGAVKESLTFVTIKEGSEAAVDLHFRTDGFAPDAAGEARMLSLVNEERTKRGLNALVSDPGIARLARAHSADMLSRGYFSHLTPEGTSPSGRADAADIGYRVFGENLALAPDVPLAHQGLMDSPGHRANILSPGYGRIGIGIEDAGEYGIMVTQNFAD